MKQWFQVTMAIEGEVEVLAPETDLPLLMVTPTAAIMVVTPDGRMYLNISSRPWFVPLTPQEASRVLDAQAMEAASELRRSSTGEPFQSTIIGLLDSLSERET